MLVNLHVNILVYTYELVLIKYAIINHHNILVMVIYSLLNRLTYFSYTFNIYINN